MSALNNKLPNLTDIPLGLEQGDNNSLEINTEKSDKIKSNSLKRFFRTVKGSLTTSKSSNDAAYPVSESEMKNVHSLQLRFGSFDENDDKEKPSKSHTEPSSSSEALKLMTSENRLKLQSRIANYWTTTFKKSSKKSTTNQNAPIDEGNGNSNVTPLPNDIDKLQNNQSPNL